MMNSKTCVKQPLSKSLKIGFQELFLLSIQNIRFGEQLVRIRVVCYFPSRSMFVCSKEASHLDVSFEHTDKIFWLKIMESYRP